MSPFVKSGHDLRCMRRFCQKPGHVQAITTFFSSPLTVNLVGKKPFALLPVLPLRVLIRNKAQTAVKRTVPGQSCRHAGRQRDVFFFFNDRYGQSRICFQTSRFPVSVRQLNVNTPAVKFDRAAAKRLFRHTFCKKPVYNYLYSAEQ